MPVSVPSLHQNNAACSGFAEQFGRIEQLAGKFAEALFFRHRQLAIREIQIGFGELESQALQFLEAR